MTFIGKWTLTQAGNAVQIDLTSGVLSVGAPSTSGSANFNAYGTSAGFVLQGANGLYVVSTGTSYAATKAATDPLNQFTLAPDGQGGVRVVDLGVNGGGPTPSYWNTNGGALSSLAKADSPPATTLFNQSVITPGLSDILSQGFSSPQPDLTWVNLSGTDFTKATANLDFTQSQLAHADLSSTTFPPQTAFDNSVATYASFASARMAGCSFGGADCTFTDFTKATLPGIQADGTDFSNATLTSASFKSAANLAGARFISAKCQSVDFSNTLNILNTDFTNADLTSAVFTGSSVTGPLTIKGANLTGAALNNPNGVVTIFPGFIKLDSKTNFTGAQLQFIDFSGYSLDTMIFTGADMTGCNFHGATMQSIELSYARLDQATFTGTVLLNGANLSNASMKGADLTNAQLGALSSLFSVVSGTDNYNLLLAGLQTDNAANVQTVFSANGHSLSGTVTITQSRFSTTSWTVQATAPTPQTYTVIQQTIAATLTLVVYTPMTPAVLSNAFMVNVKLTGANLIGINASGAAIYGVAGSNPNLNAALLQDAQFSNANLSNADFSSANLGGVSFDYAILTNAVFQNAQLSNSGSGTRASLIGANLQAANFDGATISNVAFTNAAVSVANPQNPLLPAGVWLFSVPQESQSLLVDELQAAASRQFTLTNQALQQLQTPGPVGPGIVKSFQNQGIALTSDAVLSLMGAGIYWQLSDGETHYAIFESYDPTSFTPALGVASGSAYTTTAAFFLPLSLEPSLKNGPVNNAVIAAFQSAGHPISASSQLTIAQHPTDWQIINGAPKYDVYSLWLSVISNAGLTITVRPAIPNLIAAFNVASVALSTRATITKLSTNNGWNVDNGSEDPYSPVINYITFNMLQPSPSAPFDTYGAVMRIARLKSPGQLEYYNIPPGITTLAQSQLASGTVCPNGDFATTNQTNGLPYDQWLRARVAPRPPRCIPDPQGMFLCPM